MGRFSAITVMTLGLGAVALASGPAVPQRNAPRGQQGRAAQGEPNYRFDSNLKPGSLAPDFSLEPRGGGRPVTLSSFRGTMPVALVFGSYT